MEVQQSGIRDLSIYNFLITFASFWFVSLPTKNSQFPTNWIHSSSTLCSPFDSEEFICHKILTKSTQTYVSDSDSDRQILPLSATMAHHFTCQAMSWQLSWGWEKTFLIFGCAISALKGTKGAIEPQESVFSISNEIVTLFCHWRNSGFHLTAWFLVERTNFFFFNLLYLFQFYALAERSLSMPEEIQAEGLMLSSKGLLLAFSCHNFLIWLDNYIWHWTAMLLDIILFQAQSHLSRQWEQQLLTTAQQFILKQLVICRCNNS